MENSAAGRQSPAEESAAQRACSPSAPQTPQRPARSRRQSWAAEPYPATSSREEGPPSSGAGRPPQSPAFTDAPLLEETTELLRPSWGRRQYAMIWATLAMVKLVQQAGATFHEVC